MMGGRKRKKEKKKNSDTKRQHFTGSSFSLLHW